MDDDRPFCSTSTIRQLCDSLSISRFPSTRWCGRDRCCCCCCCCCCALLLLLLLLLPPPPLLLLLLLLRLLLLLLLRLLLLLLLLRHGGWTSAKSDGRAALAVAIAFGAWTRDGPIQPRSGLRAVGRTEGPATQSLSTRRETTCTVDDTRRARSRGGGGVESHLYRPPTQAAVRR